MLDNDRSRRIAVYLSGDSKSSVRKHMRVQVPPSATLEISIDSEAYVNEQDSGIGAQRASFDEIVDEMWLTLRSGARFPCVRRRPCYFASAVAGRRVVTRDSAGWLARKLWTAATAWRRSSPVVML